ncbi:MAG: hypothetical protein ISS95_00390 [Candidatus Aenigmarchaeota archaeon]|nr:hypothetical protein [Candidatus Aenigmarchaeota archaeon]
MREKIKLNILNIITNSENGLHFSKIAEHAELSIQTVSKYCHVLEAENRVLIQKLGDMKIVTPAEPKEKPVEIENIEGKDVVRYIQ